MVDVRGNPWEHDPGPTDASGWADLFAETPNYRGLGVAVVGREAFRWHHGPMFYRGRLDGTAKVVIVGQEGAQDESLSHRSFTGGTGARMQNMLRFIGIDRSYLFLNSFIYPIFGQYTQDLRPLAQDPRSPIAIHRNRVLDKAVVDGDVRLVIAVGTAAKESIATWIKAHGGSAQSDQLHNATLGSIPARVHVVGVVHPGSAVGGSTAGIKADFQLAINRIRAGSAATRPGCRSTRGCPAISPRRSRIRRPRSRFATSHSVSVRAWGAAARRATGATTSGRSASSRRSASTTRAAPA